MSGLAEAESLRSSDRPADAAEKDRSTPDDELSAVHCGQLQDDVETY